MAMRKLPSHEDLVDTAIRLQKEATGQGVRAALLGGVAMRLYGSPRLTGDVDFVAEAAIPGRKPAGTLTFGGLIYQMPGGVGADWILREDYQKELYAEALDHAIQTPEFGLRIVTPEYLAAIKFAARRSTDYEDLMTLLGFDFVNGAKAEEVVGRLLGGYAGEEFQAARAEAAWRRREKGR